MKWLIVPLLLVGMFVIDMGEERGARDLVAYGWMAIATAIGMFCYGVGQHAHNKEED